MTKKSIETAILDYVLVCEELYQYFEDLLIDEARQFTLTKYGKGKGKNIQSDHNPMLANFNICYEKGRKTRRRKEIFNLKNSEGQANFFEATNGGSRLQDCFNGNENLEIKSNRFLKTLDDVLHTCFRKIRIKSGPRQNEITTLIQRKSQLSLSLPSVVCKLLKEIIESEIMKIEDDISCISASRN